MEHDVLVGLTAIIFSVREKQPRVLVLQNEPSYTLPYGPFDPTSHRTLELALRDWVHQQTGLSLGYVEQLYTFGNRHRDPSQIQQHQRQITVGYLALIGPDQDIQTPQSQWQSWYDFLPWEDRRTGPNQLIIDVIVPRLSAWAESAEKPIDQEDRNIRVIQAFGLSDFPWDPERVIQRFELLYEAGLVQEAHRDWQFWAEEAQSRLPITEKALEQKSLVEAAAQLGLIMSQDHRRILASAIGRLRGKLKYRPVVFELLPQEFTLLQLQKVVESLSGSPLHKQNFRRLMTQEGLVRPTGNKDTHSPGRPAELYRFRKRVLRERPAPGVRIGSKR